MTSQNGKKMERNNVTMARTKNASLCIAGKIPFVNKISMVSVKMVALSNHIISQPRNRATASNKLAIIRKISFVSKKNGPRYIY